MSTYLAGPRDGLSFGDVCAAEFMFDVHARLDARQLGTGAMSARFAEKNYGVAEELTYFLPGRELKDEEHYVLAHGAHQEAVVLSDDCLIASALGRDGQPTRQRVLFAPLAVASAEDVENLEDASYGRFPLPADEHYGEHRVVELRKCFMVDARAVHAALQGDEDFQLRSLDEERRSLLAVRWAAYAVRRGPFVAEDNASKFATAVLEAGLVTDENAAGEVATLVANVVAASWVAEGLGVEGLGVAADEGLPIKPAIDELVELLAMLRDETDAALAGLRDLRTT